MKKAIIFLLVIAPSLPLWSHGSTYIEEKSNNILGVRAFYDSGEPIAQARVLVFAPDESEPWLETVTDPQGGVAFIPDKKGEWVLQIRADGGHGLRINLNSETTGTSSKTSLVRKIAGSLLVIWGTIGTVLFFQRRR